MRSDRCVGFERGMTTGAFATLDAGRRGLLGWGGDVRFPAETRGGASPHPHRFRDRLDGIAKRSAARALRTAGRKLSSKCCGGNVFCL